MTKFDKFIENMSCNMNKNMSGGGYSINTEHDIAGNPRIDSYYDCSPPVLINGKLKTGKNCQPLCGGSKEPSKKTSKKPSKKISKKVSKKPSKKISKKPSKKISKKPSKKISKKVSKKPSKKISKKGSKKKRKQLGGNSPYPFDGRKSVFTADMNLREFGCRQPTWNPACA